MKAMQFNEASDPQSLDPIGIYKKCFDKTIYVPIKFREQQGQEQTTVTFKIKEQRQDGKIIVFIQSQSDIFFLYRIDITAKYLHQINGKYQLKCESSQHFIQFLWQSFEECQNKSTFVQIYIKDEVNLVVKFFKECKGKVFTIVQFDAKKQKTQTVKMMASYRYGLMRQDIAQKQARIAKLKELVKLRNPYLMTFFNKL